MGSLSSRCPYGSCISRNLARVQPDDNEPTEICHRGTSRGALGMIYRAEDLLDLNSRLARTVWDASRPSCLPVDVALAAISDKVVYYAVPGLQTPGFLSEVLDPLHDVAKIATVQTPQIHVDLGFSV